MKIAEIKQFLENLLAIIGFTDFEINIQENSQDKLIQFFLKIDSRLDDSGLLIGRNGENLQALEYFLNILLKKNAANFGWRIILDINNYRAMQEEKLREFARKIAHQVAITNQMVELPPMRARDRRIIHLEIALRSDVTTESIGENKERHIVIKPRENNLP
ncbi:MAG: R3H domain-containing nucleic acid-binding protein [Candidatus Paceibacterota bacterium]|jgi:spoIIIJ-associated protein